MPHRECGIASSESCAERGRPPSSRSRLRRCRRKPPIACTSCEVDGSVLSKLPQCRPRCGRSARATRADDRRQISPACPTGTLSAGLRLAAAFTVRQRLSSPTFAEAHAGFVSVCKFHAGLGQRFLDYRQSFGIPGVTANLDVVDGIPVKARGRRQVPYCPVQAGSCHSYLCACHRHLTVLLSHVPMAQ
jgi:hypothetical protein